jgi:hypothetical protein
VESLCGGVETMISNVTHEDTNARLRNETRHELEFIFLLGEL